MFWINLQNLAIQFINVVFAVGGQAAAAAQRGGRQVVDHFQIFYRYFAYILVATFILLLIAGVWCNVYFACIVALIPFVAWMIIMAHVNNMAAWVIGGTVAIDLAQRILNRFNGRGHDDNGNDVYAEAGRIGHMLSRLTKLFVAAGVIGVFVAVLSLAGRYPQIGFITVTAGIILTMAIFAESRSQFALYALFAAMTVGMLIVAAKKFNWFGNDAQAASAPAAASAPTQDVSMWNPANKLDAPRPAVPSHLVTIAEFDVPAGVWSDLHIRPDGVQRFQYDYSADTYVYLRLGNNADMVTLAGSEFNENLGLSHKIVAASFYGGENGVHIVLKAVSTASELEDKTTPFDVPASDTPGMKESGLLPEPDDPATTT